MAGIPGIGDLQGRLAIDAQALGALRAQAKNSPDAALDKVASQFEALFLQMMLKSMRESVGEDGLFDSEATRTYVGMLDQQLASSLSGKGSLGLAEMLSRQLRSARGAADGAAAASVAAGGVVPPAAAGGVVPAAAAGGVVAPAAAGGVGVQPPTAPAETIPPASVNPFNRRDRYGPGAIEPQSRAGDANTPRHVRNFIDRIGEQAGLASRETGVPARFIAAQAALESNWGRSEIRGGDGAPSYNLFGIKAGRGWNGKTVQAATTEYVGGSPVKTTEKFRAYDSYADAFLDYARLLKARYKDAVAAGADAAQFAQGLQRGGYATDPAYADKVARIINTNFSVKA